MTWKTKFKIAVYVFLIGLFQYISIGWGFLIQQAFGKTEFLSIVGLFGNSFLMRACVYIAGSALLILISMLLLTLFARILFGPKPGNKRSKKKGEEKGEKGDRHLFLFKE